MNSFNHKLLRSGNPPQTLFAPWSLKAYLRTLFFCALVGLGLGLLAFLAGLNPFEFEEIIFPRTCLVLFVMALVYYLVLPFKRSHDVVIIISIPVITQFYQVILGREYPDGATSLLRILPLFAMFAKMLMYLIWYNFKPSLMEALLYVCLLFSSTISLFLSINLTMVGFTQWFLIAVLLPTFYFYVGALLHRQQNATADLCTALCLNAFFLLSGAIVITIIGADALKGGVLLASRNFSDFNNIYSYSLLLLPFCFAMTRFMNFLYLLAVLILYVAAVLVGLSRTALVVTPLLLVLGIILVSNSPSEVIKRFAVLIAFTSIATLCVLQSEEIMNAWFQRFNVADIGWDALDNLMPGSTDYEIRSNLRKAGYSMFQSSPLVGHGWGAFKYLSPVGMSSAHSFFLDILVESGIIGVMIFFFLIAAVFWQITSIWLKEHSSWLIFLVIVILVWLLTLNTLGGTLSLATETGFQVNAINGFLFTIFIHKKLLRDISHRMKLRRTTCS